jgi:uncharacterized protein YbjT (DUF2867 family)
MLDAPVLVVGATGRTGRLIVRRLLERGAAVRALVRDRARSDALLPPDVSRFVGDVRRVGTLAAPMAGAGVVIVATSGGVDHDNSAELVDYYGTHNVVSQAAAAGVDLLVFVSTIYASRPEHYQDVEPTSLGWKARAEEVVRESGIPYCIVRSGWLIDGTGGAALAVSQGDTAEGRLSRADLARACVELVTLPEARGKTFELVAMRGSDVPPLADAIGALAPDAALHHSA